MCKLCQKVEYHEPFYYKDNFCTIIGSGQELQAIYKWHSTPKPRHTEWIEMQLYVIACKMWGQEGQQWHKIYHLTAEHPYWIARPVPNNKVGKREKAYNKLYKTKEIE